jgi:hypothetical protein
VGSKKACGFFFGYFKGFQMSGDNALEH